MTTSRKIIFPITLLTAILSVLLFAVAVVNGWFGQEGGIGDVFCEASRPGYIKQPANTFSNIGFIVAGLIIAWQLSSGRFSQNKNSFTRTIFYGAFFSCLAVLLGPGSMALHATTAKIGGFFDMLSMYLIASFVLAYSMQRSFLWKPLQFTLVFLSTLAICLWANFQEYEIIFSFFGNTAFAFFITLTIVFEGLNMYTRKMKLNKVWGYVSLLSLLTAFVIWNLSRTDAPFCDPSSLVQGHGIWHLLCAFSVYSLFRMYVSEQEA
ncbi:MAG: ceramidase domain-containing protein [Chitinophagales bacterium]|nr:ceramidase domain-containing protein [Chitinophagales bacterium]